VRGHDVDGRADLYALGVTAYEVLSGRLPFEGDDPQALLRNQLLRGPRPLHEVAADAPSQLAELVMRLLSPDPRARPSLHEVRAALRVVEEEASKARTRTVTSQMAGEVEAADEADDELRVPRRFAPSPLR
jgi:serine/threonine-protein kinase